MFEFALHVKWGHGMDESLMPDWMKRAKESRELERARADSASKDHTIAQMKVQNDGPLFWKDLVEKLTIQKEFLPSAFGLNGSVNVSESHGGEMLCRVDVARHGLTPRSGYINLFYRPGGSIIRCHSQSGTAGDVGLGVVDGKVILILAGEYRDPEQSASWFIQELVRQVKPEALRQTE